MAHSSWACRGGEGSCLERFSCVLFGWRGGGGWGGTGKVCWLGVVAFNHSSVSVFGCSRIEGSMGSQVLGSVFTTLVQVAVGGGEVHWPGDCTDGGKARECHMVVDANPTSYAKPPPNNIFCLLTLYYRNIGS